MTAPEILAGYARVERFDVVGSTNDIVRGWLAEGTPEVCVAVADRQTSGRGRNGRTWTAPAEAALLVSTGFRPTWLDVEETWRLAAIVALAIAEAAEDAAGLEAGSIRLKWPNDLVVVVGGAAAIPAPVAFASAVRGPDGAPREIRKIAGILGETDGLGTPDPRAVIGAGINVDWAAADFPPDLAATMSSLREVAGGRPISRDDVLDGFLGRLEALVHALRGGRFDAASWAARQVTTGHLVSVAGLDGSLTVARAMGVDGTSGALIVEVLDAHGQPEERRLMAGEVRNLGLPSASVV